MDPALEAGVRDIVAARRAARALPSLPEGSRPRTLADAYAMQAAAIEQWGGRIAGWKIGATAKSVQELFGIAQPIYGPVFADTVFESPARLRAADFQHRMIEAEFALVLRQDLPARPQPYRREEIVNAIGTVTPALEIVSPRFETLPSGQVHQLVADFCANGGAILGTPHADWRALDLPAHVVTLDIGGQVRQRGTGALALGGPLKALEWLVNTLAARGIGLSAGHVILTGTVTGIHAPAPGEPATADFGALGQVRVIFEA